MMYHPEGQVVLFGAEQLAAAITTITNAVSRTLHDTPCKCAFSSSSVPGISIADYAQRLAAWNPSGADAVVLAIALMHRHAKKTGRPITPFTQHRLLLVAVVVATKTHYDFFYKNAYMARVGGVAVGELASLELQFVSEIDWEAHVTLSEAQRIAAVMTAAPILDSA